jgi:hypothetical protein
LLTTPLLLLACHWGSSYSHAEHVFVAGISSPGITWG